MEKELYFITFTDILMWPRPTMFYPIFVVSSHTRTGYAYFTPPRTGDKTAQGINKFLSTSKKKPGNPTWVITDNAGKYTSQVVMDLLGDVEVYHVATMAQNPEENWISERFLLKIMNSVRPALMTARLDWKYWIYALADVVDKHNQIPHSATEKSPHAQCFQGDTHY